MKVEMWSIDKVIPYARNPRKNDAAVPKVMASLKEYGFRQPIVVDKEGVVIVGHTRLKAAQQLGMTEVPVHIATGLTASQVKAYRIADNRTSEEAEWDQELLGMELSDLREADFDLNLTGFDGDAIEKALNPDEPEIKEVDAQIDRAEELRQKWNVEPGQIWTLGNHRMMCGDSTKAEDVEQLMDGQRADLMLTDPPYNVDYTGKTKDALKVANDSMADGDFRKFLVACFGAAFDAMKPGASFYVFHADSEGYNFRGAVKDCGQTVRQCLVWAKNSLVMGRQDYQWQHEPCLYGWKEGAAHGWYSDRKQTTLLRFDRPTRSEDHPTMKPVAMFAYLMGNSTAQQGVAYDPFCGSGTTLIAAEQLGRKCYGMEISPAYCAVILQRWADATGGTPCLAKQ